MRKCAAEARGVFGMRTEEAKDALRDEMAKAAAHAGVQQIGTYLTERLEAEPEIAEKLLTKGKSLRGAFGAIYEYAKKHRTNSFAYVPPEKAYEIVDEYYGIADAEGRRAAKEETHAHAADASADALDLDSLLDF